MFQSKKIPAATDMLALGNYTFASRSPGLSGAVLHGGEKRVNTFMSNCSRFVICNWNCLHPVCKINQLPRTITRVSLLSFWKGFKCDPA